MHSYLFPFGWLEAPLADQLTRWLGVTHLITPTPHVENEIRGLVDSGRINLCHPTTDLENQLNQHWETLKNWRLAHDGMAAQDLQKIATETPFYDPDHAHRLRDDIRREALSASVSPGENDDLFQAWILLKAAYDYDLQNAQIGQHLRATDERHQGVMEFLKGGPQHQKRLPRKAIPNSAQGADQGLWKPILRLKSWTRIYLQQCVTTEGGPGELFVTTSSIILDQILSEMADDSVWHQKISLDLGRNDSDRTATATQLQQRLSQLAMSQKPETAWTDFGQWSATNPLESGLAHLDLWMIPNLPPHRFWSSLFRDINEATSRIKQPATSYSTLLGQFSIA